MTVEIEVAKYQFQSWARKGIAAQINEEDTLGKDGVTLPEGERASVPIGVAINAMPQTPKDFALIGPGDIVGIQRDMVVRTEPRHWVTNVEPNYLAFIEFYDEDFPWRYTPARPNGDRLRPWLSLLVMKEDEFDRDDQRLPLPIVTVKSKEALPPSGDSWLCAHVHTEVEIATAQLSDLEEYLNSLRKAVATDPDMIYSRLLSPRHLEPNEGYHAFLVPTFEVGRLAGLGQPTDGIPAQTSAWNATTTSVQLPFYYDWFFRTGAETDFESLVALLEPRLLDARIGIRSMDCSQPGFVKVDSYGLEIATPPGEQPGLDPPTPIIQGVEGALKTDRTESLPEIFQSSAFSQQLQLLVNLPETIEANFSTPLDSDYSDEDFFDDPVVSVPFYGQNHARQKKSHKVFLDITKGGWYHELNRDPRLRVPAGLGTGVIQKHQEKFMQRAWQQVQKVYEANRILHLTQFFMQVSHLFNEKFFAKLAPAQLLAVTLPLHAKILGSPTTIRQQLLESRLLSPVFSAPFRRLVRPAGRVAKRLRSGGVPFAYNQLVTSVNEGRVTPAPPRRVPAGLPTVEELAERVQPRTFPAWLLWLMRNRVMVLAGVLVLLAFVVIFSFAIFSAAIVGVAIGSAALAVGAVAAFQWLRVQEDRIEVAAKLTDPVKAKAALEAVPARPNFNVLLAGEKAALAPTPGITAESDSIEAANFRSAAGALQARLAIRPPQKAPLFAYNMENGSNKIGYAIDPQVAFPSRLWGQVHFPMWPKTRPEDIVDAIAHPDFEEPMYTYLRDTNKELLIPNLKLIPPNTISLLETNPKFIEAYLVGLNHEMGRELLWREYPTDMRGSYFRQFWEVKGISNPDTPEDAELMKEITKIHSWQSTSLLGHHKPQPAKNGNGKAGKTDVKPGDKQLVLVIRGELLKRYPNAVIYAQKAHVNGEGTLVLLEGDPTMDEFETEYKFPLFRAEIEPDLRFFGFDLTADKAKGKMESNDFPKDKLGWFFVIQEVPGEPRFGMDIAYEPPTDSNSDSANDPPNSWNNLAWNCFGETEPAFVKELPPPTFPGSAPLGPDLTTHQWAKNSAEMAYILFQTPVMVAVHASEMLEKL